MSFWAKKCSLYLWFNPEIKAQLVCEQTGGWKQKLCWHSSLRQFELQLSSCRKAKEKYFGSEYAAVFHQFQLELWLPDIFPAGSCPVKAKEKHHHRWRLHSNAFKDYKRSDWRDWILFRRLALPEAPTRAEFLQKRLISAFFRFQWQKLAEILHLFKKYDHQ